MHARTLARSQRTFSHMHGGIAYACVRTHRIKPPYWIRVHDLATSISAYRDPCGSNTEPMHTHPHRQYCASVRPKQPHARRALDARRIAMRQARAKPVASSTNHLDAPGRRARIAVAVVERANLRAQRVPRGVPRLLVLLVLVEESASAARRGQQGTVGDCAPVRVRDSHTRGHTKAHAQTRARAHTTRTHTHNPHKEYTHTHTQKFTYTHTHIYTYKHTHIYIHTTPSAQSSRRAGAGRAAQRAKPVV